MCRKFYSNRASYHLKCKKIADIYGVFNNKNIRLLWHKETIGPCPCSQWGHPCRLTTFIPRLDFT